MSIRLPGAISLSSNRFAALDDGWEEAPRSEIRYSRDQLVMLRDSAVTKTKEIAIREQIARDHPELITPAVAPPASSKKPRKSVWVLKKNSAAQ